MYLVLKDSMFSNKVKICILIWAEILELIFVLNRQRNVLIDRLSLYKEWCIWIVFVFSWRECSVVSRKSWILTQMPVWFIRKVVYVFSSHPKV